MADSRLTTPSFLVLGIIDKLGEASPYDVKVEAARTVAPFWSMPAVAHLSRHCRSAPRSARSDLSRWLLSLWGR